MTKKLQRAVAGCLLGCLLSVVCIPVFASSYNIKFDFDSKLYGQTRYYENGDEFTISTDARCDVTTSFDVKLYKVKKKNDIMGYYVDKSFNSANMSDSCILDGDGPGYYYTVFIKPKKTYGKYCVGKGTISDE